MPRIRLLREAGGLGDVVRCLGVARSIKATIPDSEIWFYTLPGMSTIARMCPDITRVVEVAHGVRRARDSMPNPAIHRYLRTPVRFDATIDQYCPAYQHERDTQGRVAFDRLDLWHMSASKVLGVDLPVRLPWLPISSYQQGRASGWLEANGLAGQRLVGLEVSSVAPQRSWPDLQWAQVVRVIRRTGARVLVFHRRADEARRLATDLDADGAASVDLELLVALVAGCDLLLGVDSGLLHVAAAVGTPAVAVFGITSGEILCKHYSRHRPIDAGPSEREGLGCEKPGRACYKFGSLGWSIRTCGQGCWAMNRIEPEKVAFAALERLGFVQPGTCFQDLRERREKKRSDETTGVTGCIEGATLGKIWRPRSCKSNESVEKPGFVRPS